MTASDSTTPTTDAAPVMFTAEQVLHALNTAANDILDAARAGDEGLRDGINLMVNATIAYLRGEADDLHDVAEGGYGEDLATLGWIGEAA
jgi:hypothetical protein